MVFFFAVCPTAALSQNLAEPDVEHALTFEFKTPHINWARPYARGKIRALFFVNRWGTKPRECVELMQRFDIEADAIFYGRPLGRTKAVWQGGKEGLKRMEALLKRDWNVFVFLGVPPAKMPAKLRQRLVEKVKAGSGMVLSGIEGRTMLPGEDAQKDAVPFLAGIDGVRTFVLGKGRGVQMPARLVIDYAEGWQNTYETWQEKLGRALLWAAGKAPKSELSFRLPKGTFIRTEPAELRVQWNGAAIGSKPILQLWIRKPVGWVAPWPDCEIAAGEAVNLTLPRLRAGGYHLDGRVVSSAGVETWATIPFGVTSPRRIAGMELNPDWSEIGGKITGSVTLSGPAAPGEMVRVDVLDKDRRVLLRKEAVAGGDRVDFSFDIPPWMPMLATVESSIINDGETLASAYRYFHVTRRNRDQFNFLMWDVPRGTLASYAEEALARTGVTLQLAWGNPPPYVAANGVAWVPYTTRILARLNKQGIMTPFCWNDEAKVQLHVGKLAEQHRPSRQHGVFVYSLGDEDATKGACLALTCLEAYRRYLKGIYGLLDALNRSWGTHFGTWEEVGLSKAGDNDEARSFRQRNYPRWFDRQAFKSYNFVQYALKYAEAYRRIDPQAKTGFEGAGRFTGGDDIDLIVRDLGFWSPYPGTADEVIRSIAPRDFPRANWMGYAKDADSLLRKYWRMVTRGMDAVWWWRWEGIGKYHGWLAPDLRPYPAVRKLLSDTQIVRDGLGDLLLKSQMQDDGIAILYSYPSTFACRLDEGATFGDYEKTHIAWQKAIRDLGLQFSYVTDRMMRLGEFDAERYKALILPRAEAIGDKEAAVIREFVEKGGLVIADLRPGIYDDHCKKRKQGVLDDLFGIRRVWYAPSKEFSAANGKENIVIDPGIASTGGASAASMGGAPVLVLRKMGKGAALFLNGDIPLLQDIGPAAVPDFFKEKSLGPAPLKKEDLLGLILRKYAGIAPQIRVEDEDGAELHNVEITRWVNGGAEIFSLFRQGGHDVSGVVKLRQRSYVYDLRNRQYLGNVKEFRTRVLANRASFFAVLKEPVPPAKLNLAAREVFCGRVARAEISLPGAEGLHAFRIRIDPPEPKGRPTSGPFFPRTGYPVDPGKKEAKEPEWVSRVVLAGSKPVTFDVPIAYNDPEGDYKITATELFSNISVSRELRVLRQGHNEEEQGPLAKPQRRKGNERTALLAPLRLGVRNEDQARSPGSIRLNQFKRS